MIFLKNKLRTVESQIWGAKKNLALLHVLVHSSSISSVIIKDYSNNTWHFFGLFLTTSNARHFSIFYHWFWLVKRIDNMVPIKAESDSCIKSYAHPKALKTWVSKKQKKSLWQIADTLKMSRIIWTTPK